MFSDDTFRMFLTSVVLLSLVSPSLAAVCVGEGDKPQTMLDWWRDDVVQGNRGFHVTPADKSRAGAGGIVFCMAKGFRSNTDLLDPVVKSGMHIADFYQESHMPCEIMVSVIDVMENEVKFTENKNITEKATANRRRQLLADDSCAVSRPSLGSCSYPGDAQGQEHWGGVSFKISQVNENHTTPDGYQYSDVAYEPGATGVKNELQHVWTHSPVYGGDRKACEFAESSASLYKSGVVIENFPLPYDMKYKVYMFASDTEREAALDDTRNVGLKYARSMKGENGCDAEIVYEFFPKSGGGLMVELSQIAKCTSSEENSECASKRHAITDSTSAYVVDDSVIVQVKKSSLRSAQYLPVRPDCDNGMTTTVKMSSQFICAATGERINITSIKMSRTKPGDKEVSEISRDPANPTTFQVDSNNPSTCYWDPSCRDGNQHDVDIRLDADAASAPESCGSFFWDPLIYSVSGDGMAASVAGDSVTSSAPKPAVCIIAAALFAILPFILIDGVGGLNRY